MLDPSAEKRSKKEVENDSISTFFSHTHNDKFVPRTVYVDLEPTVVGMVNYFFCCGRILHVNVRLAYFR